MPLQHVSKNIVTSRLGGQRIKRIYKGTDHIWDAVPLASEMAEYDSAATTYEASLNVGYTPTKNAYLTKRDTNTYLGYFHLGDVYWSELQLSSAGIVNGPHSWNQTRLFPMYGYELAKDSSASYGGTWSDLTTGDPNLYIGGRARQTQVTNATVTVTFTGGGDVWVVFVGRTSGVYVRVQIDGADPTPGSGNELVTLPTATGVGFDSYTAVDLTAKQRVKIATGLSSGSHTVVLTSTADKNPAALTGTRFIFNGLALVSSTRGIPSDLTRDTSVWATGQTVALREQRQYQGNHYSATGAGTTGAAPPTHTTGTVSDGGVSWLYMSKSSYTLIDQFLQAAGSQLEYAYQFAPTGQGYEDVAGASSTEDVGGILHRNETLNSLAIQVNDVVTPLAVGGWVNGAKVEVIQDITATHSITGNIANQILTHILTPGQCQVTHTHEWLQAGTMGYFYAAMWPLLHWHASRAKYSVLTVNSPIDGSRTVSSYYGQHNPNLGRRPDLLMDVQGDIFQPDGSSATPSAGSPTHRCRAWCRVTRESVNDYQTGRSVRAGKAVNISSQTAPGFSSVVSKLYFERCDQGTEVAIVPSELWSCDATYKIRLEAL